MASLYGLLLLFIRRRPRMLKFGKVVKNVIGIFIIALEHVFLHLTLANFAAMSELTKKMCWELVTISKDTINGVGVATYRKPTSNECYTSRSEQEPPICADSDDPNASWYVFFFSCFGNVL